MPLVQGTLDLLVLGTLAACPGTATASRPRWSPAHRGGAGHRRRRLYQALHRLDGQGLVEAEWRPSENNAARAVLNAHGGRGGKRLRAEAANWRRYSRRGRGRLAGRIAHVRSGPPPPPFGYLRRRPEAVESEVDEGVNAHLGDEGGRARAEGMPADAARREALRRFGDLEGTRRAIAGGRAGEGEADGARIARAGPEAGRADRFAQPAARLRCSP